MANTTMIYVTHDQVEAMTLADRIVVLKDGYVEQVGTPMDLYKHPGNLFVAQFIGSPAMNILPATIEKTGQDDRRQPCRRPQGECADRDACRRGRARRSASACGRKICRSPQAPTICSRARSTMSSSSAKSSSSISTSAAPTQPLVTKLPGNAVVERGTKLKLTADAGDLHIFDDNGHSFATMVAPAKAA